MKSSMLGAWIDQVGESGLFDPPQALEQGMLNQVEDQGRSDGDEPIDRIVDELHFVHSAKIGKISAVPPSLDSFSFFERFGERIVLLSYG